LKFLFPNYIQNPTHDDEKKTLIVPEPNPKNPFFETKLPLQNSSKMETDRMDSGNNKRRLERPLASVNDV